MITLLVDWRFVICSNLDSTGPGMCSYYTPVRWLWDGGATERQAHGDARIEYHVSEVLYSGKMCVTPIGRGSTSDRTVDAFFRSRATRQG